MSADATSVRRSSEMALESHGLIGVILSSSHSKSNLMDDVLGEEIRIDRKMLPESNYRLFDDTLGTLLNGYAVKVL
jgi:hypothetical protein